MPGRNYGKRNISIRSTICVTDEIYLPAIHLASNNLPYSGKYGTFRHITVCFLHIYATLGDTSTALRAYVRNLHSHERNLHLHVRNLYSHERNLHSYVRNLHLHVRNLHSHVRSLHSHVRNLYSHVRNLHSYVCNLYSCERNLYSYVRNLYSPVRNFGRYVRRFGRCEPRRYGNQNLRNHSDIMNLVKSPHGRQRVIINKY